VFHGLALLRVKLGEEGRRHRARTESWLTEAASEHVSCFVRNDLAAIIRLLGHRSALARTLCDAACAVAAMKPTQSRLPKTTTRARMVIVTSYVPDIA